MLLRLFLIKFKGWRWHLGSLTKLPKLLDEWPQFYDLETFEPMIEYLGPWDRKLEEEKMGLQPDLIWGGQWMVLLFILFFEKPLRTRVGGLGPRDLLNLALFNKG